MIGWVVSFLVVAIIASVFAFSGSASIDTAYIAKIVFVVFVIQFFISIILLMFEKPRS